jgi:maltose alpha-D-glucosyltransferase/alpha-amylase
MKLLIRRYRECPELSWGRSTILESGAPSVFAHRADYESGTIVAIHNFAAEPARMTLAVTGSGVGVQAVDLLCDGTTEVRDDGVVPLDVFPYGCRWLRIVRPGDRYIV